MVNNRPTPNRPPPSDAALAETPVTLGHGDVVIAAITSCTNTSNPSVMIAAGLLARKALERGLITDGITYRFRIQASEFRSHCTNGYLTRCSAPLNLAAIRLDLAWALG